MANITEQSPLLQSEDDLFIPFRSAEKPKERWAIGAEAEKFGVFRATGAPLHYASDDGKSVQSILETLIERHAWMPEPEVPGGALIALRRGNASVTLEPGGQLELSGAPLPDVHAICAESRGHLAELRDISEELGVMWLGLGFHPIARQADLDWVPKARYEIMKVYLPAKGTYALDMMRRTATVQANFDFVNEEDAMKKLAVSMKLSPVVTAIFANSPFYEGRLFGGRSYRARVWLSVDPDRQGLVPATWHPRARYSDYVAWALDCPMFMIKRDGKAVANTGQTFRSFFDHGFQGHKATLADWEMHINTLFPEVRLKRTLEVRGADSLPADLACALPALWTGILYDEKALDDATALTESFTHDELLMLRSHIPDQALRAPFRGQPLAALAEKVLTIASDGLERRKRLSRDGQDERVHLSRIAKLVERGCCPADDLVAGLETMPGDLTQELLRRGRMSLTARHAHGHGSDVLS